MKYTVSGAMAMAGLVASMAGTAPARALATPAFAVAQQTDGALKDRIEYRLETSSLVRKYDIDVKVDQGVAKLSGAVATAAQKAEAEKLAKIDGISKVESTITVEANADRTVADRVKNGLNKAGEKITDAWITTKVNWFFVGEDLLKGSHIDVDTKDNVVTLKGTVASAAGKSRAVELARETDGVKRVVDQLTVATSEK